MYAITLHTAPAQLNAETISKPAIIFALEWVY